MPFSRGGGSVLFGSGKYKFLISFLPFRKAYAIWSEVDQVGTYPMKGTLTVPRLYICTSYFCYRPTHFSLCPHEVIKEVKTMLHPKLLSLSTSWAHQCLLSISLHVLNAAASLLAPLCILPSGLSLEFFMVLLKYRAGWISLF